MANVRAMKRYIPVILALMLLVVAFLMFDVRVIYQVSEEHRPLSGSNQVSDNEFDEKTKAQLITEYQQEAEMRHRYAPQQTTLYNEIEFLSLITQDFSLFFHVSGASRDKGWEELETLNGQTVNMNYTAYTYTYEYRMLDRHTNKEMSGNGSFALDNKATSNYTLNISGVKLDVGFRSKRSLFIKHPMGWESTVIDAEEYETFPLNIHTESSNTTLQPTSALSHLLG
jgi:hypothetical protein